MPNAKRQTHPPTTRITHRAATHKHAADLWVIKGTIGELVTEGDFELWDFSCGELSIQELGLTTNSVTATDASYTARVGAARVSCDGRLDFDGLKIEGDAFGIIPITLTISGYGRFKVDSSAQNQGNDVQIDLDFAQPAGFANKLPESLRMDRDTCDVDLDLGLSFPSPGLHFDQIKIYGLPSLDFSAFNLGGIVAIVVAVVEGIIAIVVCQLASQLAFLYNPVTAETDYNLPGIFNQLLNSAHEALDEWAAMPDPVVADEEAAVIAAASPEALESSIDFSTSRVLQLVSIALNDWFGSLSTTPGYEGKLIVNEAIDLLAAPRTDGSLFFSAEALVTEPFTVDLAAISVSVLPVEMSVGGLNTFEAFAVAENNYAAGVDPNTRHKYTLEHHIGLDEVFLAFKMGVTLADGWWVPENLHHPTSFTFRASAMARTADVAAATLFMIDPTALEQVSFSQLIGDSAAAQGGGIVQRIEAGLKCARPALHAFNITSMTALVDELLDPQIWELEEDPGLQAFINSGGQLVADIARGALRVHMPDILQHGIRGRLNNFVGSILADTDAVCAPAPPVPAPAPGAPVTYLDFTDNIVFTLVEVLVNNVLGGSPVRDSPASINGLVQSVLERAAASLEANVESTMVLGSPEQGTWTIEPNMVFQTATPADETFEAQVSLVRITNLDSIHELLINGTGPHALEARIVVGDGDLGVAGSGGGTVPVGPLGLEATVQIDAPGSELPFGLTETFTVGLGLSDVTVWVGADVLISVEALRQLDLRKLLNPRCLLAVLGGLELDPFTVNLSGATASLTRARDSSAMVPARPLDSALGLLSVELAQLAQVRLNNMVNYILRSIVGLAVRMANEFEGYGDYSSLSTCDDGEESAVDEFISNIPVLGSLWGFLTTNVNLDSVLNATRDGVDLETMSAHWDPEFAERRVVLVPAHDHGEPEFFDWDASLLGAIVPTVVGLVSRLQLRALLNNFADSDSDLLTSMFTRRLDDQVTLELPFRSWGLGALPLDGFIDGGFVYLNNIAWSGLYNLDLSQLQLLEPLSRFVVGNRIAVPGTSTLELNVSVVIPVEFVNGPANGPRSGVLVEDVIVLRLQMADLVLAADLLLALNLDWLQELRFGHFLQVDADQQFSFADTWFSCAMSAVFEHGVGIANLVASASAFSQPEIVTTGHILSPGVQALIVSVAEIALALVRPHISLFTQSVVRPFVNDWLLGFAFDARGECPLASELPAPPLAPEDDHLDLQRSNVGSLLVSLNNVTRGGPHGTYELANQALAGIFDAVHLFPDPYGFKFNLSYYGEYYGKLGVYLQDLGLVGVGTLQELNLFMPSGSNKVVLNVTFVGPVGGDVIAHLEMEDMFLLPDDPLALGRHSTKDDLHMTITLERAFIDLEFQGSLSISRLLLDLHVGALFNTSQSSCAFGSFDALQVTRGGLGVSALQGQIECVGQCNSALAQRYLGAGNVVTVSTANGGGFTDWLFMAVEAVDDYVSGQGLNDLLMSKVANASSACDVAMGYQEVFDEFLGVKEPIVSNVFNIMMGIMGGLFGVLTLAACGAFSLTPGYWRNLWRDTYHRHDGDQRSLEWEVARLENLSFATHPAVPLCVRLALPIVFIVTTVLLVYSLTLPAFALQLQFTLGGDVTPRVKIVEFSMQRFVDDFWSAGAYGLSIVLVLAAIAYPLVKNFFLLVAWCAPSMLLPRWARYIIADALDVLGRWSFADVFIVVVVTGILKFTVDANVTEWLTFLPAELLKVETHVTALGGLQMLTISAASALIATHFIMWYHGKVKEYDHDKRLEAAGVARDPKLEQLARLRLSVWKYRFVAAEPRVSPGSRFASLTAPVVVGLSFSAMGLLVAAGIVPMMRVAYTGVVGLILRVVDADQFAERDFSFFTFPRIMREARENNPDAGDVASILMYELLMIVAVILMPFLQLVGFTALFFVPLTLREQQVFKFAVGICSSWASLEVMLVAIWMANEQASGIGAYILQIVTQGRCTSVVPLLNVMLGDTYGSCLDVSSRFLPAVGMVVFGVMLQLFTATVLLRFANLVIADRERATTQLVPQETSAGKYEYVLPEPNFGWLERTVVSLFVVRPSRSDMPATYRDAMMARQMAAGPAPQDVVPYSASERYLPKSDAAARETYSASPPSSMSALSFAGRNPSPGAAGQTLSPSAMSRAEASFNIDV